MVWFAGRGKVKESPDTDFISTDQPGPSRPPRMPYRSSVLKPMSRMATSAVWATRCAQCPSSSSAQSAQALTGWAAARMPTMEKEKGRPFTWTRCSRTSRVRGASSSGRATASSRRNGKAQHQPHRRTIRNQPRYQGIE